MSINRVDVQHAVKEVARFMAEAERGSMDHAQASGSIICGSRQASTSDLRIEVRQGD